MQRVSLCGGELGITIKRIKTIRMADFDTGQILTLWSVDDFDAVRSPNPPRTAAQSEKSSPYSSRILELAELPATRGESSTDRNT